ncbi:hypothetical protein Tco_1376998 [Tanacetum coccineum]
MCVPGAGHLTYQLIHKGLPQAVAGQLPSKLPVPNSPRLVPRTRRDGSDLLYGGRYMRKWWMEYGERGDGGGVGIGLHSPQHLPRREERVAGAWQVESAAGIGALSWEIHHRPTGKNSGA